MNNYKEQYVKYYGVLHVPGIITGETVCGKTHNGQFVELLPSVALKQKHCKICFEDYVSMEEDNGKSANADKRRTPMATW